MTGFTLGPRQFRRALLVAVLFSTTLPLASYLSPRLVNANPGNFPLTLNLHKQSSKTINLITTTLWANATQLWSTTVQTEIRNVRNTQPGQWDYYSQPAMAGNLTITAPITIHLWMSASTALSGTTLATTLFSVAPWGAKTSIGTVSTTQNIGVTPAEVIVTIGSLSTNTIPAGYILNLEAVLTVSGNTLRTATVSYDTATFPDRFVLTSVDHFAVQSISYYNSSYVAMSTFSRNWTTPQRQIVARANVSDAVGLYQISAVSFTAIDPL